MVGDSQTVVNGMIGDDAWLETIKLCSRNGQIERLVTKLALIEGA